MDEERASDDIPPLTKEEQAEMKKIEKVLAQSRKLTPKVKKPIFHIKDKQRNYEAITTRLEEMLDSYLVIGFDNAGNDYVAVKAPSPIDNLALNALIERFVEGHFSSITSQQLDNMRRNDDDEDDDD